MSTDAIHLTLPKERGRKRIRFRRPRRWNVLAAALILINGFSLAYNALRVLAGGMDAAELAGCILSGLGAGMVLHAVWPHRHLELWQFNIATRSATYLAGIGLMVASIALDLAT